MEIIKSLVGLVLFISFSLGCYLAYWVKGYILLPILPEVEFERSLFRNVTLSCPRDVFKQIAMLKGLERTNELRGYTRTAAEEMLLVKPFERNSRNPYIDQIHGHHVFYAFDTYGLDVEYENNKVKTMRVVGMLIDS